MKPEVSQETVFGESRPRFVRTRRILRHMLGPLPVAPLETDPPASEQEWLGGPDSNYEAVRLAKAIRGVAKDKELKEGVLIQPIDPPYEMIVKAKAQDTSDTEVTTADIRIRPTDGRNPTEFHLHTNRLKPDHNHLQLAQPRDATVSVIDTDTDEHYLIGDYHPVERPQLRRVMSLMAEVISDSEELRVSQLN